MKNRKRIILTIALLSYFVTAIDSSIVITGLEKMTEELSLNQTTLSWVQNAYVLAFGGFILLGGKLSDIFGRKHIINMALILFGGASAVAGAAENAGIMIAARFVQGAGAAIMAPTSLALLMDTFEGKERVKAVAWYSSISGLGSSVGLVLGGLLASYLSWRDGFYINVPITLFMLFLSLRVLKDTHVEHFHFDLLGTVLSIVGIFALVYAINGAEQKIIWFGIALVFLIAFLFTENRSSVPVMPLELFRNRTRAGAYLVRTLYMCAMLGFWFFISEYLQRVLGYSPIQTGLSFFPMTFSLFAAALLVPYFAEKIGDKIVLWIGIFCLLLGFLWALIVTEQSAYFNTIMPLLILMGFGQGFCMSPLTNLGIYNIKAEHAGSASGLVNVAHQVGGSIGLAIMVSAGTQLEGTMSQFHLAMVIGFGFILTAAVFTLCLIPKAVLVKR